MYIIKFQLQIPDALQFTHLHNDCWAAFKLDQEDTVFVDPAKYGAIVFSYTVHLMYGTGRQRD